MARGAATPSTEQIPDQFVVRGGLDLVTAPILKKPGTVIAGVNREPRPEGLRRIDGFERLDGQPAPSQASYWIISFGTGTAGITTGQTVTGATSGATGKALIDGVVSSGSYGGGNAVGFLVLTVVSGTFQNGENLQVSAVTKCVATSVALQRGATNDTDDATYLHNAMETARALIQPVPGSGRILGVWYYLGVAYAFRNNVGGTAAVMYKSTASGWTAVTLSKVLKYTAGTTGLVEGATLTGATSGATGVITRLGITSGTLGGSNAVGQMVFASITGTFQNGENLQIGGVTKAVANGASSQVTLQPNGTYEFITFNFFGASNLKRMYGVDGVNNAFEFDGTVYAPILTGMTNDAPTHLQAHYSRLWMSFAGGSLQKCVVGQPFQWTAILGASEIGLGDEISAMIAGYAGVIVVYGRNKTAILYGQDESSWLLKDLSQVDGCYPSTAQLLGVPMTYDNFGIRGLLTIQNITVNFQPAVLSSKIKPLIDNYVKIKATPTASIRVRQKNQYRLFFSDGTGLVADFSAPAQSGVPEFMPLNYGKTVRCCCSTKDESGNEVLLFGSDDGYVYQLDSGTNFDGAAVTEFARFAFNNCKSPTQIKRFHKLTAELSVSAPNVPIYCTADFSGGDPDQPSQNPLNFSVSGGGGFWNESNYNQFYWSARTIGLAEARIEGEGTSISPSIGSATTYEPPTVLSGMTVHFSKRRLTR